MLHACFVRSPFARARIESVDVTEALALPGVLAVFLAGDLNPDVHEQWYTMTGPKMPDIARPPLAEGEVRFVGDPVALVVAESRYVAEDAGMAAVMNQYLLANGGRRLGDFNPFLYKVAEGSRLPGFRDVTLGGNAVADAAPGYDLVTGLGTPDVDNLVRNILTLQKVTG